MNKFKLENCYEQNSNSVSSKIESLTRLKEVLQKRKKKEEKNKRGY